jgi:hypothetical protein
MSDALEPQTIVDQPIPLINGTTLAASGVASNPVTVDSGAEEPKRTPDAKWPIGIVSADVVAESLDTQTRKIKGAYSFEQMGSISIGQYINGVSGEIDISPNGIIAKNVNGETTFILDATTGDATFKGTVIAGAFNIIDSDGLISLNSFENSGVNIGANQPFTDTTWTDVTGSAVTTNFSRTKVVFTIATITSFLGGVVAGSYAGRVDVQINVDGNLVGAVMSHQGFYNDSTGETSSVDVQTGSTFHFDNLGPGTHTIKLQAKIAEAPLNLKATILGGRIGYIVLGN